MCTYRCKLKPFPLRLCSLSMRRQASTANTVYSWLIPSSCDCTLTSRYTQLPPLGLQMSQPCTVDG